MLYGWGKNVKAYLGRKFEIIRSASSGEGGGDFSSGGTGTGGLKPGAASSVGWNPGENLALQYDRKTECHHHMFQIYIN